MTSSHPTPAACQWFSRLAAPLDRRSSPRLALLFLGAILARGRRTVTTWIRAAKLSDRYQSCYIAVAAAGKRADRIARRLLIEVVRPLLKGATRLTLALDDTPTKRYGPHVQAAGIHHNRPARPTSMGTSSSSWPCSWPTRRGGGVALPLQARFYVRKTNLPGIDPKRRSAFRTKLELAIELLRSVKPWLALLNLPIWMVADGAYANAAFLKPAKALGMTVVSRLCKDAALRTLPGPRPTGKRGRPRTYGEDVIDLAKRGGQRRGWSSDAFELYGEEVVKKYKTFLATRRPAGGAIRVVLVDEPTGWRAYFCTETTASVADILGMVADRFSLEITFREVKQVVGAGQQQVRFIWANIGAFHICLWTFTLTEAWAWSRKEDELVDRSTSPWDKASRRPRHADKRRAWRRELLGEEIRAVLRPGVTEGDIQATVERLLRLAP